MGQAPSGQQGGGAGQGGDKKGDKKVCILLLISPIPIPSIFSSLPIMMSDKCV
jgi:hypothetical protein